MQHVQCLRNHYLPSDWRLNALPCCWLDIWQKKWPSSGTKKLYDDNTAHLLRSNYWLQPIYQELLHSSSRYNATGTGEKKRPSNGLARISAHPRPPKKVQPAASGSRFTDWIGGMCYADTLQVWFPAHWAPLVIRQLQRKGDEYRAANPSWVDENVVPDDIRQQWHEAQANRRMQFKV